MIDDPALGVFEDRDGIVESPSAFAAAPTRPLAAQAHQVISRMN
jgi:hypothetical protein